MVEPSDTSYEILDLGRGSLSPGPPLRSDRRRLVSVGLALVVGVGIGAVGWDQWRDHQKAVADQSTVVLAGGLIDATAHQNRQVRFSMVLENLSPAAITVEEIHLAGWPRAAGEEPLDMEIQRGKSALVSDEAVVTCLGEAPTAVSALVRTADGVARDVPVHVPNTQQLAWPREMLCSSVDYGITASSDHVLERGPDFIRTSLVISNNNLREVQITGITAQSRGFDVEAVGLPWVVPAATEPSRPGEFAGEVVWRVADCSAATEAVLSDADLHLLVDDGSAPAMGTAVPHRDDLAPPELIRLGVMACE